MISIDKRDTIINNINFCYTHHKSKSQVCFHRDGFYTNVYYENRDWFETKI